jgi:hypothetical protein
MTPEWLQDEIDRRTEADATERDRLARRAAYDDWARAYADSGVRVDPGATPRAAA